ncbi:kinase-like protein [Schizopora paradoxa]|uniref:Kinase-like protein n=1 Tax=Schizopora paradoxa TaxID=27342 RepID=A0A0H2RGG8_9AGAM|nr:kinase-like protein [Schizopora paradoxa]
MSKPIVDLRQEIVQELLKLGVVRFEKSSSFIRDVKRASTINGGFSTVYPVQSVSDDPNVTKYAIKVIKVEAEQQVINCSSFLQKGDNKIVEYFKRECTILNACAGPGVKDRHFMEFLGIVDTFNGSALPGMVFSYAQEGNLKEYLLTDAERTLSAKEKLRLMTHLIKAIAHLHSLKMIHRDIKAENVLLDRRDGELTAFLSDLGSARDFTGLAIVADSLLMTSWKWSPPEFLFDQDASKTDEDGSGDVWSYACTVIEVLASLSSPWPEKYTCEHIEADLSDGKHPPRPSKADMTNDVWNFLESRCFCFDPGERITSREARDEMLKLYNDSL